MTNGAAKKRPACVSCVVRSALNPTVAYDQVLCSVCGGTGVVTAEIGPQKPRTPLWVLLVLPLMLGTMLALLVTTVFYQLELNHWRHQADQLRVQFEGQPGTRPMAFFKQKLNLGMTREEVKEAVGLPNSTKDIGQGLSDMEVWYFNCTDGRFFITLQDGRVQNMKQ
jgi:hypothetical protein